MKPYGVPRNLDVESPDIADINLYGFKSRTASVSGISQVCRSGFRSSSAKRNTRRIWKKLARRIAKIEIRKEIELLT